jgi:hypothetical protein
MSPQAVVLQRAYTLHFKHVMLPSHLGKNIPMLIDHEMLSSLLNLLIFFLLSSSMDFI